MNEIVLQTFALSKNYGSVRAVAGIDLPVYRGEVFGFLGPNGAGKTTTIGMALGLIHPTSGQVELFGERVSPARVAPLRRVGALVGAPSFVPRFSARRNLQLVARLYPGVGAVRIDEVLDLAGIAHAADRPVKGYSTGMKQRLGLAAALIHHPELILLDEPTNGLDPAGMREVRDLLRGLAADGTTVFLSSHLLHEVEQTCDRVAVLNRGQIVAQGRVSELLGRQQVVRVRVASPAAARDALLQSGVAAADLRSNGSYLEVAGLPGETIVERLAAHQIYPAEVVAQGHDLEATFLELTKESA
ncbi:MAG: ABC transporter ATP-binding protein [Anaerolineae bacterium]|nr:ABC transporter ATP-binding protein [Anaerolineae bacterium]